MYQWLRGTPLSGLMFPMVTASGTMAGGYDPAQLSSMIALDGGAWQALGSRITANPGNGFYTITSLSSTEMTCYFWMIRITAASGCLTQGIAGYNLNIAGFDYSGTAAQVWNSLESVYSSGTTFGNLQNTGGSINVSSIAAQVWNSLKNTYTSNTTMAVATSGNDKILTAVSGIYNALSPTLGNIITAVSGLKNDVSGLPGMLTAISAPKILASAYHSGATVMAVANAMSGNAGTASVDMSGIAKIVWNSDDTILTSQSGFGAEVDAIMAATSAIPNQTASGFLPILAAVSAVPVGITVITNINTSAIAAQVWNSDIGTYTSSTSFGGAVCMSGDYTQVSSLEPILQAISGLKNDVSGLPGTLVAVSSVPVAVASGFAEILAATSAIPLAVASGFMPILTATSGVPLAVASGFTAVITATSGVPSAVASGFMPILTAVSGIPLVVASGWAALPPILAAVSGVPLAVASGWTGLPPILAAVSGLKNDVSGLPGILVAASGIVLAVGSGFAPILVAVSASPAGVLLGSIQDGDSLTSGTVAHTLRLLRWFSWDSMYVDKTYSPARLFLKSTATNYSSWWNLTDTSSMTSKVRGG